MAIATCANGSPPLGLAWQNITVSSDGKAIARGIGVGVGTPHQQVFALSPSFGDDNTWLFNAADCVNAANATCIAERGGVYNQSLSHTFSQTTQAQWNGTDDPGETATGTFVYFYDELYFGSNGSVAGFPLLLNQPGHGSGSGLGMGAQSTFLDLAVKSGSAPSKAFGLWVGSRSEDSPADGALWIGGYDSARVAGDFVDFAMSSDCTNCVKVTNITYITRHGSTSLFSNSSEFLEVALEPFVDELQVPPDIFANFLRASNGTVAMDPELTSFSMFPTNADLGNLSVTFDNGYQTVIPSRELFLPPRSYAADGNWQISNNTYLINYIMNFTADSGYVGSWGKPFLTMNYITVDYDNQTFSLAPAEQGPYGGSNAPLPVALCKGVVASASSAGVPTGATSTSSTSSPTTISKPSHTNVGAIAGGVIGGLVGLALIAILAFFLLRRRKRERALQHKHGSVGGTTAVADLSEKEHAPQGVRGSVTEISEADEGKINHWLDSQPRYEAPTSPLFGQPIEMPAHPPSEVE